MTIAIAAVLVGGAALATAEVAQEGKLRLTVNGGLSPRVLPREGAAPVAVSVSSQVSTTDESPPPQLKALQIEFNRIGQIDSSGLPICQVSDIQPASTSRALAACRSSLIGQGRFSADIHLSGQEPYATQGRLLVFNGLEHGHPVLLGQIYTARPFANSFVIVFKVGQAPRGRYGTVLTASLPKALGSWGNVTGIEMRLFRRYRHDGRSQSYLSAGCPAPKGVGRVSFPLARTSFSFAGGRKLTSTLTRTCKARE